MGQREIIKPEYNEPCTIKLGNAPTLVEGAYGHQWRYFVNDDEGMLYADEKAHEAIQATGARNGQIIRLHKSKDGRKTVWQAVDVDQRLVPVRIYPGEEPTMMAPWEYSRYQRLESKRTAAKASTNGNGHSNGNANGHHADPPPPPTPPPAPAEPNQPGARLYAMALRSAIDVAKWAQDHAAAKGLTLQFTSEDVRCIAATLYIDQQRRDK